MQTLLPHERQHYIRCFEKLEVMVSRVPEHKKIATEMLRYLYHPTPAIDVESQWYVRLLQKARRGEPFAGGMNRRWQIWRSLFPDRQDAWEKILRQGWMDKKKVPINEFPYPHARPPSDETAAKLYEAEKELWELGVIQRWDGPSTVGGELNIMAIDKGLGPDGKPQTARLVVDASAACENEEIPRFRGSSTKNHIDFIRHKAWLLDSDLAKFFFQVLANWRQYCIQKFWSSVHRGVLAVFVVMTMGMKGAPRVAAILNGLPQQLVAENFEVEAQCYVDEVLNQADTPAAVYLDAMIHRTVMCHLGMLPNWAKTRLSRPRQQLIWCGVEFFTRFLINRANEPRLVVIQTTAVALLGPNPTVYLLCQFKGQVGTLPLLHMDAGTQMYWCGLVLRKCVKRSGGRRHEMKRAIIPTEDVQLMRAELQYWAVRHPHREFRMNWSQAPVIGTLVVDASMYGWAGTFKSIPTAQAKRSVVIHSEGWFNAEERQMNHNWHEAAGADRFAEAVAKDSRMPPRTFEEPGRFHLKTDNSTTVAANNKARVRDRDIAIIHHRAETWRHKSAVFLTAEHIGKHEMDSQHTVDARGRKRSKLWDRSLPAVVFRALLEDLGIPATTKIIDMCATRSARQVRRFVSKVPDAQAVWTDMYTHEWNTSNGLLRQNELLYFFPPENQLDRVSMKIQRDASPSVLIIMPLWSRSWLKRIQGMLISQPVVFGGGTQLLEPPEGRHIAEEIKQGQWQWVAALIDGRLSTTVSGHWDSHLNRPEGQWQVSGKKTVAAVTTQIGRSGQISARGKAFLSLTSRPPTYAIT